MLKEALRNMETALKELAEINTALDEALIVAITDKRGIIIFANEKFCKISKYSRSELLGQNHRIINSGYHSKEFFKDMWKTIANGKVWRGEIRNRAKDGSFYWMDTTIVPCLNDRGKPYQYVSFRIDITDRKRAEEHLRRSDKVAAAGELASGIAHEIRNPLAAIKWSLLQLNTGEHEEQFKMILSEIDRIDSIVDEFLLLSKPRSTEFARGNIRHLLEMVVTLMNVQARRSRIDIHLEFLDEVPEIICEENQLKQVFINLIKNAMEAMPDGGNIRVQVSQTTDKFVRIRIADEGCGIPEEILSRLGEAFFTTKDTGTGLGIMMSHKIIQDHQGLMHITSEVDKGTIIDVLLPMA